MGAWQRGLAAAAVAAVAVASFIGADAQVSRGILEIDTRGAVDVPRKAALVTVSIKTEGVPPMHVRRGEAAYNEIKVILRRLGVSDADVRDTSVNIGKACSYRCSELKKRSYAYRANLDVLLPTIDAAVAFLGQLKARPAGEVSVGNIRFPLVDADALVRIAQQLSIDALEAQASAMTSAMGGRLGDIVALRSRDNKDSLLSADRNSYRNNYDRTLDVYTTGRIEMFHNFS